MYYSDFSRRPIDGEQPNGQNPNNLDEFDEIKRQINNLSKVTGSVSWKKVEELSRRILANHAKDIRCACYYGTAATHNRGVQGLVDGLGIISDICLIYWHSAYPPKDRSTARMSSFEWYVEHTERQQRKLKVSEEDLPLIELGHHLTMKIDEELRQHYGVKGPSLAAIRRILSQWQDDLKAEQARKSELLRKQKAALAPPPSVPQPSITLDVSPSKSPYDAKAETPKHTEPPNNKKQPIYLYALIATGLMIGTFGRIAYTENKIMTLSEQVELSSISNLSVLTSRIAKENEEIREELKNSLLTRSEELVNNLIVDPDNINKLKVIENILKSLNDLYPDSASTQKITEEFKTKKSSLEVQYRDINKDFQTARTYFANAKLKNPDEHFYVIAYQYSNSLFPLQGRIEFAERNSNVAELEKAQRMLNIFQYKINELKISHNKNINNQP